MPLHLRSHLLALVFIWTSTMSAWGDESFLEQFRLQTKTDTASEWYESGESSPLAAESPHEFSDSDPAAPEFDFRSRAERVAIAADVSSYDPLLDGQATDESAPNTGTAINGYQPSHGPDFDDSEAPLIRYRDTCYQGAQAAYGVIPEGSSSGLGIRSLDLLGTFAVPLGSMDHLVSFMPFFRMDDLSAPPGIDLPDALYEVGVKTFWKRVVNERLTTMALFTPSVRSDFNSTQQAFKLFGSLMLSWKIVPDKVSMFGGAMYTGRQDYPVLPTMGIYWTPSPLWKFDIQFPSPRISRRLLKDSDFSETWGYVAGVFGGNTWAVKRAGGQDDQLTLRDLRLMLGVEHLRQGNCGVFFETGLVFSRSAQYENTIGQIDFGDAIILRAGIQF